MMPKPWAIGASGGAVPLRCSKSEALPSGPWPPHARASWSEGTTELRLTAMPCKYTGRVTIWNRTGRSCRKALLRTSTVKYVMCIWSTASEPRYWRTPPTYCGFTTVITPFL